jgi:uncharacterized membrane protein
MMLVTMLLPVLPLSGLIAGGVAMGAGISPHGKPARFVGGRGVVAPVLLALAGLAERETACQQWGVSQPPVSFHARRK